ncbi:lipopolysaccharide biosynthesis protein [Clostridium perfringens]|uniref:lipopolysaccharide biosynthesis protein n=1 Tax=Clostridium perfringens TaxID=1502 RepID=UPI001D851C4A|nr:oligosaccharide flippase family protein [Clostridium perfringens]
MEKLKGIIKNNFLKNVLLVAGGTALAQIISTISSPIITRLYSPEEYGNLTLYSSIISIVSVVGALKYESTIAIAEDDDISINMLIASSFILILNTIILAIIFWGWGDFILDIFNAKQLYKFKMLIPIGMLLIGLYNVVSQFAYRTKDFKTLSKTKLNQSIFQNIISIVGGILNFGTIGLIVSRIIGQSAGVGSIIKPILKKKDILFKDISLNKMIWGMKRYIKFPIFSAPSQLLNIGGIQLPIIFLTAFFGTGVTGLFGLANSMVNLPFNLIGNAIGDVYYSEAANIGKNNPSELKRLSEMLFKKLVIIGIIPTIVVLLLGPSLFKIVFGNEWVEAGVYARLLIILVFSRFIFMPISRVYEIYERQKEAFILDFIRISLVAMIFLMAKKFGLSSYLTIFLYSIAMSLVYLNTYLLSQKIINYEIKRRLL